MQCVLWCPQQPYRMLPLPSPQTAARELELLQFADYYIDRRDPRRPRFCKHCKSWKPERAHHCSVMGRCVLKMVRAGQLRALCVAAGVANRRWWVPRRPAGHAVTAGRRAAEKPSRRDALCPGSSDEADASFLLLLCCFWCLQDHYCIWVRTPADTCSRHA